LPAEICLPMSVFSREGLEDVKKSFLDFVLDAEKRDAEDEG
jgi:hypothetical protein